MHSAPRASVRLLAHPVRAMLLAGFLSAIVPGAVRCAKAQDSGIEERWQQVRSLRAEGRYEQALAALDDIFREHKASDAILRQAFNQRVFIFYAQDDSVRLRIAAREAVTRYPDISADIAEFPPPINALYDGLRGEMFGALTINRPDGARVYLNGDYRGEVPLHVWWLPVGRHDLVLSKKGFNDYQDSFLAEAGKEATYSVAMTVRSRSRWLTRGVPAVLVSAVIGIVAGSRGGDGAQPPAIIGDPPAPPGSR